MYDFRKMAELKKMAKFLLLFKNVFFLGFVDVPQLTEYIKSNYAYWSTECEKEAEKSKSEKTETITITDTNTE